MLTILIPVAVLAVFVIIGVLAFQRGREGFDLSGNTVLRAYLYLGSFAGVIALAFGLSALLNGALASAVGNQIVYGGAPVPAIAPACPIGASCPPQPNPADIILRQQQENDRSACADYAVAVSGYSPSGLPMIVRAGPPGVISGPVPTAPIMVQTAQGPVVTSSAPPAGLIGGVINNRQLAALDVLYANYLAAGAACLTARGYQVQMNVPVQ